MGSNDPVQGPFVSDDLFVMRTSLLGVLFIARREALVLVPYPDGTHVSVGFGRNNPQPVPRRITPKQAVKWLVEDIRDREAVVNNSLTEIVKQNEFDALLSAYYQGGTRNLGPLALAINKGDKKGAIELFPTLDKNRAGERKPGLHKRRLMEQAIFERGDYGQLLPLPLWEGDPKKTKPVDYWLTWEDFP
jgi:GH24 family phage-related lysozyme (muramidase)